MRTIAILNLKGGVGKTVTAATMARVLTADHGKAVLLVDDDQQGNLTQYFGVEADDSNSTWTLMTQGAGYYPDFLTDTGEKGISIIPANMSLAYADTDDRVNVRAIEDLRESMEEDGEFDFMLIDCPPSLGNAAKAALLAADEVIVPVRLDMFSATGMGELTRQVDTTRNINPRLRVAGILGTQFNRTPEEIGIFENLRKQRGLPVFQTCIRYSRMMGGSIARHESILTYSPHSAAAKDYRRFVEEYLEGVNKA